MLKYDIECEAFKVISIDFLLLYEYKHFLQVYVDNCAYRIANRQMKNYLDENLIETYQDQILLILYYKNTDIS